MKRPRSGSKDELSLQKPKATRRESYHGKNGPAKGFDEEESSMYAHFSSSEVAELT
jgi:hypothetical protein